MKPERHYDAAIIGGGIVGVAIARLLSRYHLSLCLLDKGAELCFGTSKANSGIIHAGHHASHDTLKGRLCAPGNALYDGLYEELWFPFKRVGELVVARSPEEVKVLEKLRRQGRENGVPGLEIIEGEDVFRLEPNLSREITAALHAPSAGVINPYELTYALAENAQQNGLEVFLAAEVVAIEGRDEGNRIIAEQRVSRDRTERRTVRAEFVINAAGLYADAVARMVGLDDFEIRPRKGQEYLLDKRCRGIVRKIIFPVPGPVSKGVLVIPTLDGTIMVGPSAEDMDDKENRTTTDEIFRKNFESAKRLVPALDSRQLISAFAGVRPASSTGDFVIGTTSVPGFINAAGIQSPGLTAAPAIAEMILGILRDEGLPLRPKGYFFVPFRKKRKLFELDLEGIRKRLEADSDWGRVVCRCERISEAEIRDAVRRGATTLDGIKFRSRAGMGRCQGSFCSFRIMEIIAEELGLDLREITKRGYGSEILGEKTKLAEIPWSS